MKSHRGIVAPVTFVVCAGLIAACATTVQQADYPTKDTVTAGIFLEPDERTVLPEGVEVRKVYDKGIELTKVSEGFVSRLYNDAAGYCTIAYGHLIKLASCDGTEPKEFRNGVSRARGTEILRTDMEKAERAVMKLTNVELTDGQYAALCDFVYNVGGGNYRRSTLRRKVNAGKNDEVAFQFRRWVKAGGRVLRGLKIRREQEIELFFDGAGVPRAAAPLEGEDLSEIDIRMGEGS
ncbi:MAG: lysozyme [Gammaproteobacteria bacterium]